MRERDRLLALHASVRLSGGGLVAMACSLRAGDTSRKIRGSQMKRRELLISSALALWGTSTRQRAEADTWTEASIGEGEVPGSPPTIAVGPDGQLHLSY